MLQTACEANQFAHETLAQFLGGIIILFPSSFLSQSYSRVVILLQVGLVAEPRSVLEIQREMEQWAPIGDTIPHGVPGSGIYPIREEY
jgi:hypothetical protein